MKQMLGGIYSVGDNNMLKETVVAKVGRIEFATHAFMKWEWDES